MLLRCRQPRLDRALLSRVALLQGVRYRMQTLALLEKNAERLASPFKGDKETSGAQLVDNTVAHGHGAQTGSVLGGQRPRNVGE